jgi:glycosyltransferase involved in cell wall biosynthesis
MLVLNDVTSDSRVRKTALSVAAAGCEVTVVGLSRSAEREEVALGSVRIVRVPRVAPSSSPSSRLMGYASKVVGYPSKAAYLRACDRRRDRRESARRWIERHERIFGEATELGRVRRAALFASIFAIDRDLLVREQIFLIRQQVYRAARVDLLGLWRLKFGVRSGGQDTTRPELFSHFEPAFGSVIEAAEPDIIHAHDYPTIGIAAAAVARAAEAGRRMPWIYDAHEYVRGLDILPPQKHQGAMDLEQRYLLSADRIVTVSDALATRLQEDFGLSRRPAVVHNTPRFGITTALAGETLRKRLGLDPGVPLLVYHGGVSQPRGVHTLVDALPLLRDAHVALITKDDGPYVDALRRSAHENGDSRRLHFIGYVPSEAVSAFISDASAGVFPLTHYGNAEVALPNKLFEFIHAGLPVVCSDTEAMGGFVREKGIGEVFRAGDPADLSRAVATVLADRSRYTAALTPELLERYSWQQQERVLIEVYRGLLDEAHFAHARDEPGEGSSAGIHSDRDEP